MKKEDEPITLAYEYGQEEFETIIPEQDWEEFVEYLGDEPDIDAQVLEVVQDVAKEWMALRIAEGKASFQTNPPEPIEQIHYYDWKAGYLHYVSQVIPNLDCRVLDCLDSLADIQIDGAKAIQFVDADEQEVWRLNAEICKEAIAISKQAIPYMDKVQAIKSGEGWQTHPKGRKKFLADLETRRNTWKTTGTILPCE